MATDSARNVEKSLLSLSEPPSAEAEYETWLSCDDGLEFLMDNASRNEFVIYACLPSVFVHAVLVPAEAVRTPDIPDLLHWNLNPYTGWGITTTFTDPPEINVCPPLNHTGSKTIDGGELLVFGRSFEGRIGEQNYFEVLQKLVQILDLHYLEERRAYCRLDENGDVAEIIRVVELSSSKGGSAGRMISMERKDLDQYMLLTHSIAVRMFDFTRFRRSHFHGWRQGDEATRTEKSDLFFRQKIEPGHASYTRGVQLVAPKMHADEFYKLYDIFEEEREHESFIAHDWKNRRVRKISCAPGATANYFTKSDLPFETSPAFFKPEVLAKYKADLEKYTLKDRSISCRGGWHLQTYDINDAGQVHTYIVYLRQLPYQEQLHWKAYNEAPKGPISERSFKTDFMGEWDLEYDPLFSLKSRLQELRHENAEWWSARDLALFDKVNYPVTTSPDEWASEILHLDQLLVEGMEEKWIRSQIISLGSDPSKELRSIKLAEALLVASGSDSESARVITAPLGTLHHLRSKLKSHASGTEAIALKRQAIAEHGSYKAHFRQLCADCDQSLNNLAAAFASIGRDRAGARQNDMACSPQRTL